MDSQSLISILKNPGLLEGTDASSLQQVVKNFPFFASAQLLLAKKYHLGNSQEFGKQLKVAAAYAPDRKVLYYLIHPEKKAEAPEAQVPEAVEAPSIPQVAAPVIEEKPATTVIEIPEEEKTAAQEPVKEEINPNDKHSFAEWLSLFQGKSIVPGKPVTASLQEEPEKPQVPVVSPPEAAPKGKEELEQKPINVEELAMKSLQEDESLISATLADIYANQGKYEKAIKLYEKLSLQYPEKKDKFALKIKELKSKL